MKGRRHWGSVIPILGGPARKPRAFLTVNLDGIWHWWNKPAAWDLWRRLESGPEVLSPGQQSIRNALRLAFQPDAEKEAAAAA